MMIRYTSVTLELILYMYLGRFNIKFNIKSSEFSEMYAANNQDVLQPWFENKC